MPQIWKHVHRKLIVLSRHLYIWRTGIHGTTVHGNTINKNIPRKYTHLIEPLHVCNRFVNMYTQQRYFVEVRKL